MNGLVPVFVDVELGTYNLDVSQLEAALGPRTRAIIAAHTLGNPFDLGARLRVREGARPLADRGQLRRARLDDGRLTGSFGDFGTLSFYPAHHITMGEGGAVLTNRPQLKLLLESFRDWGRDCWCEPGEDDTCGLRFAQQLGSLPYGYDHKYIYTHVGYNLKVTDMQAAVGVAQLRKLPQFVETRRRNWQLLHDGLAPFEDVLLLPRATERSEPRLVRLPDHDSRGRALRPERARAPPREPEDRDAPPLRRQPDASAGVRGRRFPRRRRAAEQRRGHEPVLWIGVYPALTEEMIAFVVSEFERSVAGAR